MSIEVVSIGSSSAGNSYLIMAGGHNIILDVGLTAKRITAGLEAYDIAPESIEAVLITHEHTGLPVWPSHKPQPSLPSRPIE